MQFQIPQFIETEDKVVGPLSLRQFMYVGAAGGVSAILYFALQSWLWIMLSIPIVGGAAALAFIRVNGRPLIQLVRAATSFYWRPQKYVWQPATPALRKTEDTMRSVSQGAAVERILAGLSLKDAWRNLQVGSKDSAAKAARTMTRLKERYEVLEKISGERRAAKRIDY